MLNPGMNEFELMREEFNLEGEKFKDPQSDDLFWLSHIESYWKNLI